MFVEIVLRGGSKHLFPITEAIADQISNRLVNVRPDSINIPFCWFSHDGLEVCFNLRQAVLVRVGFRPNDPPLPARSPRKNDYTIKVWTSGQREPLSLPVDEDDLTTTLSDDEDDKEYGALQTLLLHLMGALPGEFVFFEDQDQAGNVFLSMDDIALIVIPSSLLDKGDGSDEEEAE
jgi:hypothetical protein